MGKNPYSEFPFQHGSIFEKAALKNSKHLFPPNFNSQKRSSVYNNDNPLDSNNIPNNNDQNGNGSVKSKGPWYKTICWWEPPENSLPIQFCQDTSIHGLKFLAGKKRHISERIFWVIAFIFGLIAAVLLINDVWKRYKENPVIVTFQPKEQDIDSIPFPAVTICNFNKFPKSKVVALEKSAATGDQEAKLKLKYVRNICNAQQSFAKEFDYAANRGNDEEGFKNDEISEDEQDDMLKFIFEESIPCDQLIRLCIFAEKKVPCKELFRPVITDYGKCCTFNLLPLPLLTKDPRGNITLSTYGKVTAWTSEDLTLWKLWNYKDGMILNKELPRPYRQKRAGMPYGLSILVDANVGEYYCPSSDSEGFRFIPHTSLEMPHVSEFANVLQLGKEVYVEINPEVTNADDEVRAYSHVERQCYFGGERVLRFFHPYTGTNCIDECTATVITKKCNCSFFYMPRDDNVRVCNNAKNSKDAICIELAKVGLLDTLQVDCGHCDNLCEDIIYHFQLTQAKLQNSTHLWKDPDPKIDNLSIPYWAHHDMSIVHIFFGSDTTVPKLRKRLYGDVDLIASTGGLLGLCLGVSVLSAVEAIYFFTFRACFKFCRRKKNRGRIVKKFTGLLKKKIGSRKEKIINMEANSMKFYRAYPEPSKQHSIYSNNGNYNYNYNKNTNSGLPIPYGFAD